jgi:hypothetical protein
MINRLLTQRACLEFAAHDLRQRPGPLLELGLGKGRTYDYLRRRLPEREIFVFDRELHAPADCIPDVAHLFLGEFRDTLRDFAARRGRSAALVHADIGSDIRERDLRLANDLAPLIGALALPGALILCDRVLPQESWETLPVPAEARDWDYHLYRMPTASN